MQSIDICLLLAQIYLWSNIYKLKYFILIMVKRKKKVKGRKIIKKVSGGVSKSFILTRSSARKIKLALKNMILFLVLGGISLLISLIVSQEMYVKLFSIVGTLLFFVSLSFLLVLLILLFLRIFKK